MSGAAETLALATEARVAVTSLERAARRGRGVEAAAMRVWRAVEAMARRLEELAGTDMAGEAEGLLRAAAAGVLDEPTPPAGPVPPTPPTAPTKRPPGGRPNPCALHVDETELRWRKGARGPTCSRDWSVGGGRGKEGPAARLEAAVARGEVPVGAPLRPGEVRRAAGMDGCQTLEALALSLAAGRSALRLREAREGARTRWRIELA